MDKKIIIIIQNILEHPLVDTFAKFIKKFKSSKSYWSVSFLVIIFTFREAIAWKYGSAISAYAQKQLEGSDYSWLWTAIEFIFDFGGSLVFALGGLIIFIILSLVKVSEGENNTITLRESFLSLLLLLTLLGMGIYGISSNDKNHQETHEEQKITHNKQDEIKAQQKITHDKLDKLEARIKLLGGDEKYFLEKYFGKDYAIILNHPQTYHNFTTLLKQTNKTADELLKEREELLNKIKSQNFSPKLQAQIDKAFKELRYEDARELLDTFLEGNSAKEKQIIQAHYLKALSFMQQIQYYKAKDEFEKIAPNIDDGKILNEYGHIYFILGDYDKALEYFEKALKIRLATLGKNHPCTVLSYNNIGSACQSKGEYNKAIEYYEKALKIRLKILGKNHSHIATSYNNIGSAWQSKGEYDKAIEYYKRAFKIQLATLKENQPSLIASYNNIGLAWKSKGEYDKAIEYHVKALKRQLSTLGKTHPYIALSYNNIGSIYYKKGEYDKAMEYYKKAFKIELAILGENHPYTAISYGNIGSVWKSEGEYDRAIEYYEKALKIQLAILGKNHPSTAISYNNIGLVWESKREYDKAIEYYEKALKIFKEIFPNGHPNINISKENLDRVMKIKTSSSSNHIETQPILKKAIQANRALAKLNSMAKII